MLSNLAEFKGILLEGLKTLPFNIKAAVLYGSWARGTQKEDSDIDILMVSDDVNTRKHKRGKELSFIKGWLAFEYPLDILLLNTRECTSNFRNHNPLFLDITWEGLLLLDQEDFLKSLIDETKAYILSTRIKKVPDGWVFPLSYRRPATLSKVTNKDFTLAMLEDGRRDLAIGLTILSGGYYDKAVYHFQQSAEKAVKAILICFGVFKKTHFVGEFLKKEIKERDLPEDLREKLFEIAQSCSEIEPEVTWSRYPGIDDDTLWIPAEEYTENDAMEIRHMAEKIIGTAKEFVTWWFHISDPRI